MLIVASVSCIYGLGDPAEYGKVTVKLQRGMQVRRVPQGQPAGIGWPGVGWMRAIAPAMLTLP